jgi:hypothetical protein
MFRIGQKVVCIESHSQNVVVKGQIYVVKGLKVCPICGHLDVDVGIKPPVKSFSTCSGCGTCIESSIWWLRASRFAPIEEIGETTYDEIMEPYSVSK